MAQQDNITHQGDVPLPPPHPLLHAGKEAGSLGRTRKDQDCWWKTRKTWRGHGEDTPEVGHSRVELGGVSLDTNTAAAAAFAAVAVAVVAAPSLRLRRTRQGAWTHPFPQSGRLRASIRSRCELTGGSCAPEVRAVRRGVLHQRGSCVWGRGWINVRPLAPLLLPVSHCFSHRNKNFPTVVEGTMEKFPTTKALQLHPTTRHQEHSQGRSRVYRYARLFMAPPPPHHAGASRLNI